MKLIKINMYYILAIIGLISIGLIIIFYIFYLRSPRIPEKSDFHADIEEIRKIVKKNLSEQYPTHINAIPIADAFFMKGSVLAGDFSNYHAYSPSFQVVYEDKTVIIDPTLKKDLFKKFKNGETFYEGNYKINLKALGKADIILTTHEHWDHIGVFSKIDNSDKILGKTILTKEQFANKEELEIAKFPINKIKSDQILEYDNYYNLAPGIVLIKAPGHTMGHQWIYVQTQDGQEFLFTGDSVWNKENIIQLKTRPRLVSKQLNENAEYVASQIRWLHDEIYNKNPNINLIIHHDKNLIEKYWENNTIGKNFE